MEKTLENLTKAFIGESQARNRYTIYSTIAKKEGFEQIAELFLVTADNEREHAKWLYRMINELKKKRHEPLEEITVEATAPTTLGSTAENLNSSIAGENYEYSTMYPEFSEMAKKEGFPEIAGRLKAIAKAEMHHEERFKKLLKEVQGETVYRKEKKVLWVCRKCGYVHEAEQAPKKCPSCDHPTEYFELKCEEY